MLLGIEYGILFVDTVDTKDQSNAVVPCILFVDTVDTKIKACNAFNVMFVDTVDTKIKCYCIVY